METPVAALPDDALADVLSCLPLQSLAVVRCVCKAWRDFVDDRALLLPHIYVSSPTNDGGDGDDDDVPSQDQEEYVFVNYGHHSRPHHFAQAPAARRRSSSPEPE